jgi:hypothetical protein
LARLRAAPPFPGVSVVAPALVPDPPLLDASLSEVARVWKLVRAYRAVVEAKCGERCFAFARGDVRRSSLYRGMANGAAALIEHGIAPIAWAAWTTDVWQRDGNRSAPPVPLVWGAKRIAERRGWFRRESLTYMGGRAVFGPKLRELIRRWHALAGALIRADEPSGGAALVERWFPGTRYDDLVREAKVESARKNAELRARAEDGEWLW